MSYCNFTIIIIVISIIIVIVLHRKAPDVDFKNEYSGTHDVRQTVVVMASPVSAPPSPEIRAQHVTPETRAFNTSQSAQPRKPSKTLPPKSPDPQGGVRTQRSSSSNKSTPLGFKIKKIPAAKKKFRHKLKTISGTAHFMQNFP